MKKIKSALIERAIQVEELPPLDGRYWQAGQEIPDEQVPDIIRNKYASRDDDAGAPSPLASSQHPGKARKPSKR